MTTTQLSACENCGGKLQPHEYAVGHHTWECKPALKYSNPRMSAVIPDWPSGRHRVTARFEIEQDPKRGERAVRITDGAAKKLTFAKLARIVDGSDGRTYIAEFSMYGFVSIMQGNMKYQQETIHPSDPRFAEVLEVFA